VNVLRLSGIFAAALFASSCIIEDDTLPAVDAQSEIYAAIAYKEKSCGQRPEFLLIVPPQPSQYGTELCSISIVRLECPFTYYPTYCLELYNIDIPGIGPP
jgi:hypothetical protein